MTHARNRYPGAQPFPDNDFSRRTFFGRERSSVALTDQILANRLVVVYAKSGLGKTSLLNAGVAPRLRDATSLPLSVRVNDIQHGPLTSVLEGIGAEAKRQQVEYVQGESGSLWTFFKSAEFWRDDLLLTPVLILDQFEELFTLQPEPARESFLSELGYLVRGVPPPSLPQVDSGVTNSVPSIRVVLSLREDFLGILEEAADHIPQIMDHRFRLTPLNCEAAAEAITGPAAIDDQDLATQPFRLEPEFVTTVLNYLTNSTAQARSPRSRYVEPFHLQLICQRIEQVVAFRQKVSSDEIAFSLKHFGGEAALTQTLANFYTDAIRSVPDKHQRPVVRRLCEQFLISPEGRRISLDDRELQRQLKLPPATLGHLVERRLLRSDRRSDSTYYELSHDALVEPVLAGRRMQALVVGWAAILAGSTISLLTGAWVLFFVIAFATVPRWAPEAIVGVLVISLVAAMIAPVGIRMLRTGLRTRERYRRRAPGEFTQPLPMIRPLKDRLLGWTMLGAGYSLVIWWGLLGLFGMAFNAILFFTKGEFPDWLAWSKSPEVLRYVQSIRDRPFAEIAWAVIEPATVFLFGWMLLRQGSRMLWPRKIPSKASPVPGLVEPRSLVSASLKVLSGTLAFAVATLGVFTLRQCVVVSHGSLPNWLSRILIIDDISHTCQNLYEKGLDLIGFDVGQFLFAAFAFSVALLRSGVRDVWNVLHHRRVLRPR
jgi:hypothetical protein